jgi:hypothetical protein
MFVVLQLPFADLRGLHEDRRGRSPRPDWRADDPGDCFIRNFGGMVSRNHQSYGLEGERAYVEFEKALAFPKPGSHRQQGWPGDVPLRLWFRRLYFDGHISGRFEIGFNTDYEAQAEVFKAGASPYDLGLLARSVCDIPVQVRSSDGSRTDTTLERSGSALGLAYLLATTLHSKVNEFPANELLDTALKVGSPSIHIRTTANQSFSIPQDRGDIVDKDPDRLFMTTVAKAQRRNTLTVQVSKPMEGESPEERARRVLFAHLNSVLHANDFLTATMDPKQIAQSRVTLTELTTRAIERFRTMTVTAPKTNGDQAFAAALKVFADSNAGRIESVVSKLEALAKDASAPSRIERIGGWFKDSAKFVTETAISASVKKMMAGG